MFNLKLLHFTSFFTFYEISDQFTTYIEHAIVFFFLNLKMVNDNETLERKNIDSVKRFMKIFHDHILNP